MVLICKLLSINFFLLMFPNTKTMRLLNFKSKRITHASIINYMPCYSNEESLTVPALRKCEGLRSVFFIWWKRR